MTDSTADAQNSTDLVSAEDYIARNYITVTSDGKVSEHFERIPGQFPSGSEAKTVNDVSFEPVSRTMESRQSGRKARRLPGILSILRYRKIQPQRGSSEFVQAGEGDVRRDGDHDGDRDGDHDGGCDNGVNGDTAGDNQVATEDTETLGTELPTMQQSDQPDDRANENSEERKVSDQTVLSRDSNDTTVTVYRRPSKRTSRPIVTVDREYVYENPFGEVEEASHSGTGLDHFSDPRESIFQSNRPSISEYSGEYPRALYYPERPDNPLSRNFPFNSRNSSKRSTCHVFAKGSDWSGQFDVHKAANAFNELAGKLNLQPLELTDDYRPSTGKSSPDRLNSIADGVLGDESCEEASECKSLRRRDRIFGRIRVMRSNLAMKAPTAPEERGLRRMKTFANFSTRTPQMVSLRGKSLVTLARFGGQSLLDLPADFAPTTLKLPVCFVTTALYLRCNGEASFSIML